MLTTPHSPAAAAQQVTLIGLILDLFLGLGKVLVGFIANSQALIVDGIHSFSDAVTDVFVLIMTRIAAEAPDANHPYGHGRFETVGTVILGSVLLGVALILAYDNLLRLMSDTTPAVPTWPALLVAIVSIFSKEWIYRYTRKVGEQVGSNLLIANAWHSRTDALSSVIVLIGVLGSMSGVLWLDGLAAIAVALLIGKIGWGLVWDSFKELVDTGISAEQINELEKIALAVPGVSGMHAIRTRQLGQDIYLDLHIMVNPYISVSEGHQIGEWVARKLLDRVDNVKDITYHIDTEDDGLINPEADDQLLPLRQQVLDELTSLWGKELMQKVTRVNLHYCEQRISIELLFTADNFNSLGKTSADLEAELKNKAQMLEWLDEVSVWVKS